jgi:hypothetical protein
MPFLDQAGRLTEESILESYRHGSDAHAAIEILLKGLEERLPASIFSTRTGTSEKRFGCVGGTAAQQLFERPLSGWTGGRMK